MKSNAPRDAVERLNRAADLCDHARALVDVGSDELAATLDQAAEVILAIDPVGVPAGTLARAQIDEAARRAIAAHTALTAAIGEELQRVGREIGRLGTASSATKQYAGYASGVAASPRVSRVG